MSPYGSAGTVLPPLGAAARPRRRRRSALRTLGRALLVALLATFVGLATFVTGLLAAPIDFATPPPPTSALLLAADGHTQFATIRPPIRREIVPGTDIPEVMRQAIISAEDERFLTHKGIDPLATIRAAYNDLTGHPTEGGSTLTQQYVKNVYVGNEKTLLRKIKEAALAVRLERKLSKEQILTDYLNALYLGNGLYGVEAASKYYYGVSVKDLAFNRSTGRHDDTGLALARASMLAGIAPAPSVWNPVSDFTTARARQQYTLNQMIKLGYVTSGQASDAYARRAAVIPLKLQPPELPTSAPEFADLMKDELRRRFAGDQEPLLFQGGLRVTTTLDIDLQTAAAQALREVIPAPTDPQGAIVAVDIRTGDVRAMSTLLRRPATAKTPAITGYQRGGFNLATSALRSTGSTIKPFTLAQALLEGQSLTTTRYGPHCLALPNPGGKPDPYRFCNAEPSDAGTYTLRRALADSINTVYLPLAKDVGRAKVAALARRAGLQGRIAPGNLSFGIGAGVEVTPLSLASAYATLADHGLHATPRFYTQIRAGGSGSDPGRLLPAYSTSVRLVRAVPAAVADQVSDAMTDVVSYGTGTAAQQPFPVFGKTGTTDEARDAWFVGCARSPEYLCVAVWMGYEDHRSMHDIAGQQGLIFGGTLPAKVFARTFQILRQIQASHQALASGTPSPSAAPLASAAPRPRPLAPPPLAPPLAPTPTPKPAGSTRPPSPSSSPPSTAPPPILPTRAGAGGAGGGGAGGGGGGGPPAPTPTSG